MSWSATGLPFSQSYSFGLRPRYLFQIGLICECNSGQHSVQSSDLHSTMTTLFNFLTIYIVDGEHSSADRVPRENLKPGEYLPTISWSVTLCSPPQLQMPLLFTSQEDDAPRVQRFLSQQNCIGWEKECSSFCWEGNLTRCNFERLFRALRAKAWELGFRASLHCCSH